MDDDEYTNITRLEYETTPKDPGNNDTCITKDMDVRERKRMEAAHTERLEA